MDEQQKKLAEELLFSGGKKPSFAKKFYFGVFDAHQIFPYPKISKEEKERSDQLLSNLKQFIEKNVDPDWIDRHAEIPEQIIHHLADMGLLGLTVSKEFSGQGMTQHSFCKVMELLAAHCASTALFVNVHQSIGLRAISIFGTPEQKARWLPLMARGEKIGAFSLTEPNAGSDASGIETTAVFNPDKNVYVINGQKQWTTNGAVADVLTVMARTEIDTPQGKQDKITAFLVTPDMAGFTVVNPSLEKVGMRGTKTANLAFKNMEVPASNVLGPLGGGLRVCLTVLDYGRTAFGATCTGAAKFLVDKAIHHAKTRYQFKRPLASFGLVKEKIANMAADAYAMDATTYMTAGLIDAHVEDIMLEAAMLKVFASDSLWNILYDTMQIYGGRSFFTDHPFERMMRDARLNMIGEGSNEVLRAFIGVVGMRDVGMELKGVVDGLKNPLASRNLLWDFAKRSMYRWQAARVPVKSSLLKYEAKQLERAIKGFGFSVVRALAKYREQVVEEQLVLDRLATSAIAIYTTTAVLSKIDAQIAEKGEKAVEKELAIAKFYCKKSLKKLNRNLRGLFDSFDQEIFDLADRM